MRVLYLSFHPTLEYDELDLFGDIGIEYFSIGAYFKPNNSAGNFRPPLENVRKPSFFYTLFESTGCDLEKRQITSEFAAYFDVLVVMHRLDWIENNLSAFAGKPVIFRSVGQSTPSLEKRLTAIRDKIHIVRYSENERMLPGYAGEDFFIPFYTRPVKHVWKGSLDGAITLCNGLDRRRATNDASFTEQTAEILKKNGYEWKLFGANNEKYPSSQGLVSHQALKDAMFSHKAYLYTHSYPASYSLNFIEAWSSGIPMIVPSKHRAASFLSEWDNAFPNMYAIPDMIEDEKTGFIAESPAHAAEIVERLHVEAGLAKTVSDAGRAASQDFFGYSKVAVLWKQMFSSI